MQGHGVPYQQSWVSKHGQYEGDRPGEEVSWDVSLQNPPMVIVITYDGLQDFVSSKKCPTVEYLLTNVIKKLSSTHLAIRIGLSVCL